MTHDDFRFFHRLRVRWAEVDMQKIVFNAHYLMYFDTAIADYWRALALPYESAMEKLGGDIYLAKTTVEFKASARMDDLLDVGMKCSRVGTSSMLFEGGLFRGAELLVTGQLLYVFADPATQKSKPVPPLLREIITAHQDGEPMCKVAIGDWATLGEEAGTLRRAVFIDEQRIPADLEWDEADATAVHAIARNRLGQVVATGRLIADSDSPGRPAEPVQPGTARIGRMAVLRVLRGLGHGESVLRALEVAAIERGDREICLHAQRSAERFYARLGYLPHGEPFEEAGIWHIEMRRSL